MNAIKKGLVNVVVPFGLMILLVVGFATYSVIGGTINDAFKSWPQPTQVTQTSP